jgi:hypothetical protein
MNPRILSDPDCLYIFQERLGIAADNGMDTSEGSPAWVIAMDEAMREWNRLKVKAGNADEGTKESP